MSVKDKLKGSQNPSGLGDAPMFNIDKRLDIKVNPESGKVCFRFWDKNATTDNGTGAEVFSSRVLQGVFVGDAMRMSGFDQGMMRSLESSVYFSNNDSIAIFEPSHAGGGVKVFTGNSEECKMFLKKRGIDASVHKILFVHTETGTKAIRTNMTIAIDQLKAMKKEFENNYIVLTPQEYDPSTPTVSKKGKEYLGPFAAKNRPKYAEISVGDEMTEEDLVALNIEQVIEDFLAWRTFVVNKGKGEAVTQQPYVDKAPEPPAKYAAGQSYNPAQQPAKLPVDDNYSDLPF